MRIYNKDKKLIEEYLQKAYEKGYKNGKNNAETTLEYYKLMACL